MHRRLAELQMRLDALLAAVDGLGTTVYSKDRDGRYTFVNQSLAGHLGLPVEAIIGHDDDELITAEMAAQVRANDLQVITSGEPFVGREAGSFFDGGGEHEFWTVKVPIHEGDDIVGVMGVSLDITDQRRMQREIDDQRKLLDTVLDNLEALVYITSRTGQFLYVNQALAKVLGGTPDQIIGRTHDEFYDPETVAALRKFDELVFATGETQSGEEPVVLPDGTTRIVWSVKVPLAHLGQPDNLLGFSTDVTELRDLRRELERLAFTDSLTGVASRRFFLLEAGQQVAQAIRYRRPLSLLILDLDNFKRINDTFGHAAGDRVLVAVAQACRSSVRDADVFGRLGGEEFAVLLPHTPIETAAILAERLVERVRGLVIDMPNGDTAQITTSIGVSSLPSDAVPKDALNTLMTEADVALYRAKDEGRDRVCLSTR